MGEHSRVLPRDPMREGDSVGWRRPEPSCTSSDEQLRRERADKAAELVQSGMLRSERLRRAMLTVRREDFMPAAYRDHSYHEVPVPLPGRQATISCPHSYPLFYEALGLEEGQRFLEVGLGSGYGAALACEVVGPRGLVVSLEIDPDTFAYATERLDRAGYADVVGVLADGGEGWPAQAPYDRICVTAACQRVPPPLLAQLKVGGRRVVPLERDSRQVLTLFEKTPDGLLRTEICDVLYVPLQGAYGKERRNVGEAPQPALIITCSGLAGGRHTRSAVRRALPHALVRGTSFRGVLRVDAADDPCRLAEHVTRTCREWVGRVTAVLAEVPSDRDALVEAAVGTGVDEVAPGESFAFRVHKRGAHGYAEPTPELEYVVGGAVWDALAQRDGTPPRVDLTRPDVLVNAEVLGPSTLVGIVRRAWWDERARDHAAGDDTPDSGEEGFDVTAPGVTDTSDRFLEVDGSLHAGSGTIVRQAVAYAALTGKAIRVTNARARRPHPGLRPQHTRAVEAVRDLVGGMLEGATVGSRSFTFRPGSVPPSGHHRWDIGTAGSATTLALAVLPLVALQGRGVELEIHGGLFQDLAPSPFHLQFVLLPLLARMGLAAEIELVRPGYIPAGEGVVRLVVPPAVSGLRPLVLDRAGAVRSVWGVALSSHLDDRRVSARMATAARTTFASAGLDARIEERNDTTARQPGAALAVFAELDGGARLGADRAGAPHRRAERIGTRVAHQLLDEIHSHATLDRFASDQILPFTALAAGQSTFRVPFVTEHLETGRWLASLFLGADIQVTGPTVVVTGGSIHQVQGSGTLIPGDHG